MKIADTDSMSQRQIAALFGVTPSAISQWKTCPRNRDKTYSLTAVIAWRIESESQKAGDLVESGPASEALEEIRRWRAKREELAFSRECGQLLRAETVNNLLASFSTLIQHAGKKLRKKYDNRAGEILEDAIDRCEAEVKRYFEEQKTEREKA